MSAYVLKYSTWTQVHSSCIEQYKNCHTASIHSVGVTKGKPLILLITSCFPVSSASTSSCFRMSKVSSLYFSSFSLVLLLTDVGYFVRIQVAVDV